VHAWEEQQHHQSLRASVLRYHTAVLFSPPRDGFSIPNDLWKLLI
jgi:hypothetical protein